jgi:anti-sigma regulatory factor (Ser/Thr protein kinase)
MISVGIVEDDPGYQLGLKAIIDTQEDIRVQITARSVEDFEARRVLDLDIALLDLGLRGGGLEGSDAVRRLVSPRLKVLVVSMASQEVPVIEAFRLGAHGYLTNVLLASEPSEAVAACLLGATREALTNIVKHAGAREAVVHAVTTGKGYEVTIIDSGRGFDTTAVCTGLGIPESIQRRMSEIRGSARIWSDPGRGTRVELAVDFGSVRLARGIGLDPRAPIEVSPTRTTSVNALTTQALAWFVVAALAYRILISPLQTVTLLATLEPAHAWLFLGVIGVIFVYDISLLTVLLLGKSARLFRSQKFLAADLSLLAGFNLWSAYVLPPGSVFAPQHEVLWIFILGAVALWTALRGPRTGMAIVAGGVLLQAAMARLNHVTLDTGAWIEIAIQEAWTGVAFAISWLVTALARRGAKEAVDEGIEAGLAIQHIWAMRDIYAEVSRSLSVIIHKTRESVTWETLMEIRGSALAEVDRLRASKDQDRDSRTSQLADGLRGVAAVFRSRGLRVELVAAQLVSDPPSYVSDRLLAATTEALRNVVEHASATHAVLRASNVNGGVEIIIRDHGRGSAERTRNDLIRQCMAEIGGEAEISSEPSSGTRVRLIWDIRDGMASG